ncbi:PRC-barrel domain-containing protein [Aquabacter cavernae]|uniref:PRC-barrel domain-containing protein n=1 Tax=Aquabacter cavernae TaxID=2496029 RepID=UPI000F8D662A|nr:PRC-barrel domain-containing protein [Aquabacter cavernae]
MIHETSTPGHVAAGDIKGSDVYDTAGAHVGIIHDLLIDERTGQVRTAVLAIGSILGMGGEHQDVPWTSLAYDDRQKGFVLGIPLAQMRSAPDDPEEDEDGWPAPAPAA